MRFLTRVPTSDEKAEFRALFSEGFENRVVPKSEIPPKPDVVRYAHVSWSNHFDGEANSIKQRQEVAVRKGDPPTRFLRAPWRENGRRRFVGASKFTGNDIDSLIPIMNRRHFLQTSSGAATGGFTLPNLHAANAADAAMSLGKAEHCVMLWLGGGMSQIDTFDPKTRGDAKAKQSGSYYDSIATAVSGVKICEHLPQNGPSHGAKSRQCARSITKSSMNMLLRQIECTRGGRPVERSGILRWVRSLPVSAARRRKEFPPTF